MRKISTVLILFFEIQYSFSQNPLVKQWDFRFGGNGTEQLNSFIQTSDGGYLLGGWTNSTGASGDISQVSWGGTDYWVIKTDAFGNKQWDKIFGGSDYDYLSSVQQTFDGGYILAGMSLSGISGDKTQSSWGSGDYWIIKTDSIGNKLWDRDLGGYSNDELYSIMQTSDSGFILAGLSYSGIGGDKTGTVWGAADYWIIKTDSSGNKLWDKDFGGTADDIPYTLQQTSDGGFIFGGVSSSGISGDKTQATWGLSDYWTVKTDAFGNKQWDKDFGGTNWGLSLFAVSND